jgi:hypothetical protein
MGYQMIEFKDLKKVHQQFINDVVEVGMSVSGSSCHPAFNRLVGMLVGSFTKLSETDSALADVVSITRLSNPAGWAIKLECWNEIYSYTTTTETNLQKALGAARSQVTG